MAPLPPENTPRFFVDYSGLGTQHTCVVRAGSIVSPAAFATTFLPWWAGLTGLVYPLVLDGVRYSPAGTNVSNPVVTGMEGALTGSGTPAGDDIPRELNFIGRSTGGRRVRLGIFGYRLSLSGYRLHTAESADLLANINLMQAATNIFLAIDGIKPIWYEYANTLYNAYWQRKIRA